MQILLSAYLDENSRQSKYIKITIVNQDKYYKINMDQTKFQPTLIRQNNVVTIHNGVG